DRDAGRAGTLPRRGHRAEDSAAAGPAGFPGVAERLAVSRPGREGLDAPPPSGVICRAPVLPRNATRAWFLCLITACAACGSSRSSPGKDGAVDAPDAARDGAPGGDATDTPRDMAAESTPDGANDVATDAGAEVPDATGPKDTASDGGSDAGASCIK